MKESLKLDVIISSIFLSLWVCRVWNNVSKQRSQRYVCQEKAIFKTCFWCVEQKKRGKKRPAQQNLLCCCHKPGGASPAPVLETLRGGSGSTSASCPCPHFPSLQQRTCLRFSLVSPREGLNDSQHCLFHHQPKGVRPSVGWTCSVVVSVWQARREPQQGRQVGCKGAEMKGKRKKRALITFWTISLPHFKMGNVSPCHLVSCQMLISPRIILRSFSCGCILMWGFLSSSSS